ncbi:MULTISPECIES: hypothetical protein [unclassified Streptomyces]|uniref:hypothetical protein n=1 Tax=unclassified Streptomyces TaxID=2593676 RepID=UPI0035E2A1AC
MIQPIDSSRASPRSSKRLAIRRRRSIPRSQPRLLAALLLAEHPALAEHRDHLAVHARRILDTSNDGPDRRVAYKALEARGHDVTGIEPFQEEPWGCGPHGDGRGDLAPPF